MSAQLVLFIEKRLTLVIISPDSVLIPFLFHCFFSCGRRRIKCWKTVMKNEGKSAATLKMVCSRPSSRDKGVFSLLKK
jgi:hypothetical protein